MRKSLLSLLLGLSIMFSNLSANSQDWTMLDGQKSTIDTKINLLESTDNVIRLEFNFEAYNLQKVTTAKGIVNLIHIPNCAGTQIKGAPDLPKISQAVSIPDFSEMKLNVAGSKFIEIDGIDIAPSKGVISRDKDPKSIPYEYGEAYSKNEFYPSNFAESNDPYIIRNVRGQNITVYPVQYNPVTKKLRIYTKVTVELVSTGKKGANPLTVNSKIENDDVFNSVLTNHFINYTPASTKYTPVSESGKKMLIVCYGSFMTAMQEFKAWKESIGYTVTLVDYSTIGSSSALKTYVTNQYSQNGISYLLLVGDHAQVPSSSTSAGYSDNNYGYTAGSDHYLDLFVGRFSAENASQLQTQIDRTIYYERDVNSGDTWFKKGVGIASNEGGSGGDDGEDDETHMNNIENDLEGYGYTIDRVYQDGGSASQLSSLLNSGRGIVNYVGHGSNTTWASMVYTQTNVNALTNENKLPFVFSVACVVGNFTSMTCFAETWLRATNNNNPTGAIVFCGSTINQSWASPMCAQDEMNDLLVSNNYVTYGGVFVNGMFQMIDEYGTDGANMADTWTVFGDPSVQMRTPGHPNGPGGVVSNPPVANFTASTTNVSQGQTVTFTSTSTNSPTSYSWVFEGGTPSTSTASNPTVTYNTIGTYDVSLTVGNAYGSDSETKANYINVVEYVPTYCASAGSNYSYEWIAGVAIGTFNNTSTAAGYTDFTSKTVNMVAGNAYNVTLTPGFASTAYNEYWKIWIDYNADGDFDDAGELAFDAGALSKTAVSGSISVPSSASGTTRMRVSMKYNGAQTACETFSYGEVEDYTVTFGASVPDTQAPTVPTGLASSNVTSSSASISWNASTDNVGVTGYEVYRNGSLVSTVTTTSYSATGLTAAATYAFTVKAKDAAGNKSAASSALNVTTLSTQVSYCASKGSNVNYEWIDYVALGGMTNTTAANGGYADFTSKVATVTQGASTTISYSCGFSSSSYTEFWNVWVDWNQNGIFDSNELMVSGSSSVSSTLSSTFTVPSTALLGSTRMRVSMKYNAAPTSCETFSYGEVEDYTVNVTTGNTFARNENIGKELGNEAPTSLLVYPNPANDYVNVMINNGSRVGTINIYSITGSLVKVVEMNGFEREVSVSDLPAGSYIISVTDEKESLVKHFIKK